MRIAIIGSRGYPHKSAVEDYIATLPVDTVVITGAWPSRAGGYRVVEATAGVDRRAYQAAERRGLVTALVSGSKSVNGNRAGLQRNPITVALSDAVVAFWTLTSTGTAHTLGLAARAGKGILVIGPDGAQVPQWQRYLKNR